MHSILSMRGKNNYTSFVAVLQIENILAVRKKKSILVMSEQSGPFMQHMLCLQHGDLDDQLSAASTTIQHCSQTKRNSACLPSNSVVQLIRETQLQISLWACKLKSVCVHFLLLTVKQAQRLPKSLLKCWFVAVAYVKELWTWAEARKRAEQEKEDILHNLRINLTENYTQYSL